MVSQGPTPSLSPSNPIDVTEEAPSLVELQQRCHGGEPLTHSAVVGYPNANTNASLADPLTGPADVQTLVNEDELSSQSQSQPQQVIEQVVHATMGHASQSIAAQGTDMHSQSTDPETGVGNNLRCSETNVRDSIQSVNSLQVGASGQPAEPAVPAEPAELAEPAEPGSDSEVGPDSEAASVATSELAPQMRDPGPGAVGNNPADTEEWRSWKISKKWLSFLGLVNLSFIVTILSLDSYSRKNFGFLELGKAPSFLTHDKAVEQAIWSQGILYTAFPAFLMTMYQTGWHAAVSAFVGRQPFVELAKPKGRASSITLMLEYTEPDIFSIWSALRNQHFVLAASMLSSVVLAFVVVPLTSFLFTTRDFVLTSTFPISIEGQFNASVLGNLTDLPDLRFMDAAAAILTQNASPSRWATDTYAFPAAVPLQPPGNGNTTYETAAYRATAECVYIKEEDYQKRILLPGDTGVPAITIVISANDRGCPITSALNVQTNPESPNKFIHSWTTTTCPAHAGWSRFSFLSARVTPDQELEDFSLVSCMTFYYNATGNLTVNWQDDNIPSSRNAPQIKTFNTTTVSEMKADTLWLYFEWGMQAAGCYDPAKEIESDNEFGRQVYRVAKSRNSTHPLVHETIIDAAQALFTTSYAGFASAYLLPTTTDTPVQQLGTMSIQPTRLTVVTPIAIIVVTILLVVGVLNVTLFIYGQQKSILREEPVGMLATAAILHGSVDVDVAIAGLLENPECRNRPNTVAQGNPEFRRLLWRYNGSKIVSSPGHLGNQLNRLPPVAP